VLRWREAACYCHSALAQEGRGRVRSWSVGLVLLGFALAVFGTFVVRSGILTSVHSFALSDVGPIFLTFVGIVMVIAVLAFLYRLPMLRAPLPIESLASKEAGVLLNNLLLMAVLVAVLWGTVFPIFSELVQGVRIAVGPPFYAQVTVPLLLIMLGLLGIGPLMAWRRTTAHAAWRATRWPILVAIVVSTVLLAVGMRAGLAVLGFGLAGLVAAGALLELARSVRARTPESASEPRIALSLVGSRRRLGSHLVHFSVAVFAIGIVGSASFGQESAVRLAQGESATVDGHTVTFRGLRPLSQPGLTTIYADLDVERGDQPPARLTPSRRIHAGWENQPTSDVAIRTTFPALDDLYVLLDDWEPDGSVASFRILVNPLVPLLWVGGALYVIGVLVIAWPAAAPQRAPASAPTARQPASP